MASLLANAKAANEAKNRRAKEACQRRLDAHYRRTQAQRATEALQRAIEACQ